MYSPPPPTHPLRRWSSERFPRLLAGLVGMCLIAVLALGLTLLCYNLLPILNFILTILFLH
jgi:hypothetical protein